ncbi:hypothetical protein Bca52824_094235 [Brassica carinata]|uniref:Uncharacterized protein n=1 Tax=Brassica carinata TaxID=52824 RepID=A0A8X7P2Q8_BRACI|nr:hypothetical protein Bca52824_094235 [Brassica carinata]
MHGSAWKNLISFVQSSNRYEIPLPESSIQFPMNRQRFDLQAERNESLEKTTNILALRMMHKPTQPALIFSNWDKLDDEMKKYIIYSAHKKTKMIKSYNVDVDSETLFPSTKFPPFVEELTWDKTLEPMVPQLDLMISWLAFAIYSEEAATVQEGYRTMEELLEMRFTLSVFVQENHMHPFVKTSR